MLMVDRKRLCPALPEARWKKRVVQGGQMSDVRRQMSLNLPQEHYSDDQSSQRRRMWSVVLKGRSLPLRNNFRHVVMLVLCCK